MTRDEIRNQNLRESLKASIDLLKPELLLYLYGLVRELVREKPAEAEE